ncbi:MAG: hypothetical protein KKB20_13435 [Proteobacteria bacterium]|nr:hypothetical protein [Pseudomonadota bacterium]
MFRSTRLAAALCAAILIGLFPACAGRDGPPAPAEGPAFVRLFYAPSADVIEAVRLTLAEYDLRVTETHGLVSGSWSLKIEKGPQNDFREQVVRVVVTAVAEKETRVAMIIAKAFFYRFGSEPDWVDPVATRIFEHLP